MKLHKYFSLLVACLTVFAFSVNAIHAHGAGDLYEETVVEVYHFDQECLLCDAVISSEGNPAINFLSSQDHTFHSYFRSTSTGHSSVLDLLSIQRAPPHTS